MLINILDWLEGTVTWLPEKTALREGNETMTFRQLQGTANAIGTALLDRGITRQGVVLLIRDRISFAAAFLGVLAAGSYAIPLDPELPGKRVQAMIQKAAPAMILYEESTRPLLRGAGAPCCRVDAIQNTPVRQEALEAVRCRRIDSDPAYIRFTSGMKGVMICQRSAIQNTEHLGEVLKCSSNSVFASFSPFFLTELLLTLKYGGACCLIRRQEPVPLMETLNSLGVNTLLWAASDLTEIAARNTFAIVRPRHLHTVGFTGSSMSARQLYPWQKVIPDGKFVNLYGCAETGGACCAYTVGRTGTGEGMLPIGHPFPNSDILLLDETGREGESGEICIRGSCLSAGYFREPEETGRVFVPDPGCPDFPERIFRTGDYGARNSKGELVFLGRKDGRIQYKGHRIEPSEIETAAAAHPAVSSACCQYEEKAGRLQLFYTGACSCQTMTEFLQQQLPDWMLPRSLYLLEFMPMTPSGAIDKTALRKNARKGIYPYEAAAHA